MQREVEVGCCVLCYYVNCVVYEFKRIYGCEKGSYDDGWQVCLLCLMLVICVNVLFFIRLAIEKG